MKLNFESNQNSEDLINLRVQLLKNKSKIVKYQQIISQISQLYQLTTKLVEKLNSTHFFICNLGKILNINEIPYHNSKLVIDFQSRESLSQVLLKFTQLLNILEYQNDILKLVSLKIEKIALENEQIKENYHQLQKKHSKCENILVQSQKLSEKVNQLTLENKSKQQEITQMQKVNQQLKKEYTFLQNNLQANQDKIRDLQNQINEKNIQIQRFVAQINQEESMTAEKAKIIEKCNKLIDSVELADDEYINHYFRSNGLPLDVQKPLKNKYQLVFE